MIAGGHSHWPTSLIVSSHPRIRAADLSPDGSMFAVGGNGRIWITEIASGHTITTVEVGSLEASLKFPPNGLWLASSESKNGVHLWDAISWNHIWSSQWTDAVDTLIAFSFDSKRLALTNALSDIRIMDALSGSDIARISIPMRWQQPQDYTLSRRVELNAFDSLVFSPDGTQLVLALRTSSTAESRSRFMVALVDSRTYTITVPIELGGTNYSSDSSPSILSPDGCLVSYTNPHTNLNDIEVGHIAQRKHFATLSSPGRMVAGTFSHDSTLLAAAILEGNIHIWDIATREVRTVLGGHSSHIYSISFSPKWDLLISASRDETTRVWDISPLATIGQLPHHTCQQRTPVNYLSLSPSKNRLISVSDAATILWDMDKARPILTEYHAASTSSGGFSSDGQLLAVAFHNWIQILDANTGVLSKTLRDTLVEEWESVTELFFFQNNTRLASFHGTHEEGVCFRSWDVATGDALVHFQGVGDAGILFTLSPSERYLGWIDTKLYSNPEGYTSGAFQLWDLTSGAIIFSNRGDDYSGIPMYFISDSFIAFVRDDGHGNHIYIRDVISGDEASLPDPGDIGGFDFSPDRSLLAVASGLSIYLLNIASGSQLMRLDNHEFSVTLARFDPDIERLPSIVFKNSYLVVRSFGSLMGVWEIIDDPRSQKERGNSEELALTAKWTTEHTISNIFIHDRWLYHRGSQLSNVIQRVCRVPGDMVISSWPQFVLNGDHVIFGTTDGEVVILGIPV